MDSLSIAQLGAQNEQDVFLAVTLNGQDTGALARFYVRNGKLWAKQADLRSIGIDVDAHTFSSEVIPLDSIAQLTYRYSAARQSIAIEVPPALRTPYRYGQAPTTAVGEATSSRGLALNYDAYYQYAHRSQLSIWNELRYFDSNGVLENSGTLYTGSYRGEDSYVRFDTSWTHSDPVRLRTLRLGDTISSALDWTRPVRMAGIQFSRNYDLRPDLITFPLPQLGGTATVPSTVDLYINNMRRFSTEVPDGPFIFNDAPGITGAGNATIVTRDALGRSVSTTLPIYIDRRMLAAGLSSYSVEAGFIRRRYALESFDYDSHPAASGTIRYGLSNALTVEGHAEATVGVYNLGAGALVGLGANGVLNGALSLSAGTGTGARVALGYQLLQQRFSLDLQTIRNLSNYRDLGTTDGYPMAKKMDRATVSFSLDEHHSVAASYIGYTLPGYQPSHVGSVGYTANLGKRVSTNLSAYRDFGGREDTGLFLSVSISLDGGTYLGAYGGRQNGDTSFNLTASRSPDYEGGWGWGLQAGKTASARWGQAQTTYRGRYGEVTALAQQVDGHGSAALNASGAVTLMDGSLTASRRLYDGFALVSTGGIADIPVLHENRVIGVTDASGHYLIPDLNSYQRNRISIDGLDLPSNFKLARSNAEVVPQARSGVLAEFLVTEYRAASLILRDAQGKAIPVGADVYHEESGARTVVGYDGVAFVEQLAATNHLRIRYENNTCQVQFTFKNTDASELPTIGPLICDASG
ncbi:fimbria/pilus outer membrane usher protein [Bordetella tumulicola]